MMRTIPAGALALFLAGCATLPADGGFDAVGGLTRDRIGQAAKWQRSDADAAAARYRVAELLEQPLSPDSAVELALLNNKGLQADLQELGIAGADLVRAGRLRNPSFAFSRLAGGGGVEIERAVVFDVLGLITMPVAQEVEQRRFEQAQLRAAFDAVGVASETRRAYFAAVAAQELVKYYGQVRLAAEASNELARKMVQAGNFPRLHQMREQAFYAETTAQLVRTQQQSVAERERLTRLLGLSGQQVGFSLPERLPELPKAAIEPKAAQQTAMDKRLDVLMARRSAEATARSLGLTKSTRMLNVMNLGYRSKSVSGAGRESGYEIELELPLFDFGSARTARAEASYMQAVNRTAEVAVNAQSEVRESYSAYRTAFDLARHYRDEVVPLRKRISEENLLRYNGMLIGPFELLADAREQVASITAAVEALRDHWVAETNLLTAISGRSPGAGLGSKPSAPGAGAAAESH
jgi:outer membrane protein TolC